MRARRQNNRENRDYLDSSASQRRPTGKPPELNDVLEDSETNVVGDLTLVGDDEDEDDDCWW
jgi:hypothetical protein